jgi:uncharacterized membrane protein
MMAWSRTFMCLKRLPTAISSNAPRGPLLHLIPLLMLMAAGCNSSSQPAPPHIPTYTTIDVLGAPTNQYMGTRPSAIRNDGTVVGCFTDTGFVFHGFVLSQGGTLTTVDDPAALNGYGAGTCISSINSSGAVAGTYVIVLNQWQGFARGSDGQFSSPLTSADIPPGANKITPTSIDDAGDVAGYYVDNMLAYPFIVSSNGQLILLPISFLPGFGPPGGQIRYLSATGDAVGIYEPLGASSGFVRHSDGSFEFVAAPSNGDPNYAGTDAWCINSSGSIVGAVYSKVSHSFLRAPDGTFTIFDPPGIAGRSIALFINASGAIAGNFQDANSGQHGYLRNTDGSFVIIDDPNALPSGATQITGFNDLGQIVGTYSDAQGYGHGFIRK